ncbi:hypothetical protein BGZ50_008859, partial [Haplosporangium sp. Z 11]
KERLKTQEQARIKARKQARKRQAMKIKNQEQSRIKRREARRKARRKALGSTRRKYGKLQPATLDTRLATDARKDMDERLTAIQVEIPNIVEQELYGLQLSDSAKEQIRLSTQRLQHKEKLTFYSDGSLVHSGTDDVSMSFGVVVQKEDGNFDTALSGRVAGPKDADIEIFIDNSAVVSTFNTVVRNREMATTRLRLRAPYAQWRDIIHHAFMDQGRKATVKWVKGHSGNKGNEAAGKEAASKEARAAQEKNTEYWIIHQETHVDLRCNIGYMGLPAEDDIRKILKLQVAVRMYQTWMYQQRTQKYIGDADSVAWAPTLRIIHNNNPPGRAYTSRKDCALRAHRIKEMHGMLPTLQAMARHKPGLYQSTLCRRCEQETETVEHLWECADTMEMQMEAWKQAIEMTNDDDLRAWHKYHKEWREEQEQARQAMKVIRKSPPEFKSADEEEIWDSIVRIEGIRKRRDGADDVSDDESSEENVKVV